MKYLSAFILWVLLSARSFAHEMTPTYPELRPSYADGLNSITMNLFNRREDIIYYEIQVFDKDWVPLPFAASERLMKIDYLGKKTFEIYIREKDSKRLTYVCTVSKILKGDIQSSGVTSKICSKIKRE